jgi:YidC/Oxa1 family membrane protein insertase
MDRTAWIAVVLCTMGLVGWYVWVAKHTPPPQRAATVALTPSPASIPSVSPTSAATAAPAPTATGTATPPPVAGSTSSFPEVTETLRNSDVELQITNRGGGIAQVVLPNYVAEDDKRVTLNARDRTPIGAIVQDPAAPDLAEYKLVRQGDAVELEHVTSEQVTIRKKFFFPSAEKKDNFVAELDVDLINNGTQPYALPGYFMGIGSARPIHKSDYATYTRVVWCVNGSAKGVDVGWFGESSGFLGVVGARAARPVYQEILKGAEWVASCDQFFTTLVAPLNGKADSVWAQRFEIDPAQKLAGIEGAMHMPALEVAPGQTYTARFQIYTGPKLYHKLATLQHNEAEVMEFGFFKIISQALLNALNTLHSVLGNYVAAILALTTIVKLVLWPLQNKANRSARQMAALSPKMQELREKYKDDPTKMNQELMKLYKEYGINPVGGCLPMVIQIPIFFGLFTMLRQTVELRNSSFLWVHDLSQPDTVGYIPILGWPLNILPLVMALTNVWMMRITPKTGDATQQRIMMFTPIIFVIFCYNFAAALALYYTIQNLFTILQLYQNRRQPMPTLEKVTPPGKKSRKGK